MTAYYYKAFSAGGDVVTGEISADSLKSALTKVHSQGLIPYEVDELKSAKSPWWKLTWHAPVLSSKNKTQLTRELATLISAGLPIDQAMQLISDSGAAGKLVAKAREKLSAGAVFSDVMANEGFGYKPYEISLLRAGESASAVPNVLNDLANLQEKQLAARSKLISNMIYPLVLVFMALACFVVIGSVLAPNLLPLFEGTGVSAPLILTATIAVNSFLGRYWYVILIGAPLAYWVLKRVATYHFLEKVLLNFPLIGSLLKQYETAKIARVLGSQLGNGVAMLQALDDVQGVCELGVFKDGIIQTRLKISEGQQLSRALGDMQVIPEASMRLIVIGEETNQLVKMLGHVAELNDREVDVQSERLMGLMTPVLTILIGMFVGGMIMSVMGAIMSVNDLAL